MIYFVAGESSNRSDKFSVAEYPVAFSSCFNLRSNAAMKQLSGCKTRPVLSVSLLFYLPILQCGTALSNPLAGC